MCKESNLIFNGRIYVYMNLKCIQNEQTFLTGTNCFSQNLVHMYLRQRHVIFFYYYACIHVYIYMYLHT